MASKIERSIRARQSIQGEIHAAFDRARRNGSTFNEVLAERGRLYERPAYGKLPVYMREFIRGYWTALYEDIMRREVVFGGIIGGRLYSTDSRRPDYYGKNGIDPHDVGNDAITTARGFYWASFADKGEIRPWSV